MSWYAIDAVDRALSRTRKALFEPFDFWKWVKLAIIILLMGGFGSNYGGSGSNYQTNPEDLGNLPSIDPAKIPGLPFNLNPLQFKEIHLNSGIQGNSGFIHNLIQSGSGFFPDYFSNGISTSVEKLYFSDSFLGQYGLTIAAISLLILIILFFMYVSSLMQFVFVESLVRNEVKFWAYSREFVAKGFNLLMVYFALALGFIVLTVIAFLPLLPSVLEESDPSAGGILWFIGAIIVLILLGLVTTSFLNLAIPISIYRNTGILSAFGLVFSNFKKSWKEMFLYWLTRIVLGIVTAIIAIVLFLVVLLVLGLIYLIVDIILYFIFSSLVSDPWSWILLTPFVLMELLIFFGTLLFINVPLSVFLKYHLLSFLETWFVGADIPFFDTFSRGREMELNEMGLSESGFSENEVNF